MKKLIALLCLVIIMSQAVIGCSANNSVQFKEFYSQVIGFSEGDEISKPVPQDTILMMTNEDFQKFKDIYFTPRKIPMESPDKEKAVLYLQIPSPSSSVNVYSVKNINISSSTITVNLKKSAAAQVDGKSGFNGSWKWVMFIEIDKTDLKDNMKVVVKK
ncbi:hypothetical protein NBE98_17850 [Clostridium swellfunianum]|uniref:hypothetical protein n=1 Tax=Clostridium swellfunianum TaxID=1367462 RepID=UPI00202E9CD7|nr:hypothetical protein [Clostridium swellfunianum]MCM0650232.1 hypothetical protein [Clostridium swellfunianum]